MVSSKSRQSIFANWLGLCESVVWFVVVMLWANPTQAQQQSAIRLVDVSDKCGIDFVHTDGGTGKRYVVESVVGGFATLDFDGDGYVDIFFVNGTNLESKQSSSRNALYRNNGDFTFTDVTETAGVGKVGYGMGAVVADYDQDGAPDLYISNFGQNVLYHNNGDGTFREVTQEVLPQLPDKVGAGCTFLDIENDGDLDLYVGSYVQFSIDKHVNRFIGKHQFHPGPVDYPPSPDVLFRNEGDGKFTDVSQTSGVAKQASYSMGVIGFDADDDGDGDILVVNDQRPNTLWVNDGHGVFEDQAVVAGLAFDRLGKANGNMGLDLGDVNGDGLTDLFTTTYQDEMPVLYINMGQGLFMDQTNVARVDTRLHPHVTWGCGLVDFDNDGDLDIYVACGHFMDNIQYIDDRTSVKVRDFLLENRGGKFVDVSAQAGSGMQIVESSRGAAFEDFDNDGDIDVVVLNWNSRPSILRNDSVMTAPGLGVELVGVASNRNAVGAKLRLADIGGETSGNRPQTSQVVAGRGYQSQYGSRQHFSLIVEASPSLEVTWPTGRVEQFSIQSGSQRPLMVIEGTGKSLKKTDEGTVR